jgi:hypothetical protein
MSHQDSLTPQTSPFQEVGLPSGILEAANPRCQCYCVCRRIVQNAYLQRCNVCLERCPLTNLQNSNEDNLEALVANDSAEDCPSKKTAEFMGLGTGMSWVWIT